MIYDPYRHTAHDFICPTADGELSLFSAVDGRKVVFNSIGLGLSRGCVLFAHDNSNHGTFRWLRLWRIEVRSPR
ncbi:hypothetical protein [Sphingobium fuliginis]|uniref:hypothetical protein n=1 Tax=Sphingobium fuliginis (strain ATCC 27551) TaxID=336203 RepID=UPI001ABF1067|nr:hypothetical protein [Sphingobium fuliginis]